MEHTTIATNCANANPTERSASMSSAMMARKKKRKFFCTSFLKKKLFSSSSKATTRATQYMIISLKTHKSAQPRCSPQNPCRRKTSFGTLRSFLPPKLWNSKLHNFQLVFPVSLLPCLRCCQLWLLFMLQLQYKSRRKKKNSNNSRPQNTNKQKKPKNSKLGKICHFQH